MREWLIEHGYIKSDVQKTRDELVALMSDKYVWVISSFLSRMLTGGLWDRYNDYSSRTAPYLVWPDARLRAYLRENNISEDALPTSRPGLLRTSALLCFWCGS